ncbi:MAG: hypothetical protein E6G92_14460 [Alphaproteobacteria bacterium]|nr:MAG: hypothetical protein E6G92_14460 [Alphaproteobacteria bacterium]
MPTSIASAWRHLRSIGLLQRNLDEVRINQGRILAELNRSARRETLADYEFKVFSQWGEDGIIQHLIANLDIPDRTFVEFGVEDFSESNCRFLMMKDNWRGFVIDGSEKNIARLRSGSYFWKHDLRAINAFITRENIAELIATSGFDEIGILSVDIDGVDWHVLAALEHLRPAILIVEYNGVFGPTATVTVPYDAAFFRTSAHHSNIYYGASLGAFDWLARRRGYSLVGGNSAGSNAFFVRDDLLNDVVRPASIGATFRPTPFREARDRSGALTFPRESERRAIIADMPLEDVTNGSMLTVADLDRIGEAPAG